MLRENGICLPRDNIFRDKNVTFLIPNNKYVLRDNM